MTCELCDDGEGQCVFPYYGVAPHTHKPGPMLGSTVLDAPETWPENFAEDSECKGLGTYLHCPVCGAPEAQA